MFSTALPPPCSPRTARGGSSRWASMGVRRSCGSKHTDGPPLFSSPLLSCHLAAVGLCGHESRRAGKFRPRLFVSRTAAGGGQGDGGGGGRECAQKVAQGVCGQTLRGVPRMPSLQDGPRWGYLGGSRAQYVASDVLENKTDLGTTIHERLVGTWGLNPTKSTFSIQFKQDPEYCSEISTMSGMPVELTWCTKNCKYTNLQRK